MALKNLFDMVKADKYTADGREALIKAQEAETEDATRRTYQIGEISQKTGLQKTANGWVKPKSGKQPGAKKQEEPKNVHGAEVDKIYERQLKRIKELKAKGFTDEQIDNDKIIKQTKEDMKNVGKKPESKPAAQEEIGKFYTKFKDAQGAYDAGRQTFPEGGYKIYNTPQGYKVVDDPKTQQRMEAAGYKIEADVPADTKPPRYPGDTPEKRQNANRQRGEQLAKPAADEEKRGLQQWTEVIQGYKDKSVIEQRKSLQEKYDEFEEDLKDFDRRKLAPSEYARRINQQNFLKGALKAIDEEMESRGMDPAPRTSVPDAELQQKVEAAKTKLNEARVKARPGMAESKPAESKTYINKEGHRNFRAALEDNPTSSYDFEKTVKFAVPMSQEDKTELKKLQLFMSDEGADYKQALRSRASNLVDGNKSNGDHFPEKEKSIMKIAKAVGYDKELHKFIEEEYKGYDLGYSEDAAPRTLTGDTRIRVRKA